jgi:hypothetical protein
VRVVQRRASAAFPTRAPAELGGSLRLMLRPERAIYSIGD